MVKRKNIRKAKLYATGGLASMVNSDPAAGLQMKMPAASSIAGASKGFSFGSIGGGIANMGANMISGLINPSGTSTGVGNALQTVGSLASNIPGVGGLIGAGVNVVGGLVNAAFGSKLNKDFINQTEQSIDTQSNYVSNANTTDSLLTDWSAHKDLENVKKSQVGKDGWFSNKAKKTARRLNSQIDEANSRALMSLSNTADNVDSQQDFNIMANYAAYGGYLSPFGSQAIDYDLANKELDNKELDYMSKMRITSLPNSFAGMNELNTFADGGGIHIKKKNRGKFTEYCGGKVTSECIARGKRSSNPAIRKRATFAQNARGWKHDGGGFINGGDFTNGVTFIDNGGTHEENPNQGVQIGTDPQGIPNLVEEGEVLFNNYVFSDRIKVPKEVKRALKLGGNTFAKAAKNAQKESSERPNDPISKRGLAASMTRLMMAQEAIKDSTQGNTFAEGGPYKTYNNYKPVDDDWYTPEYMNFVNSLQEGDTGSLQWLGRINSGEFGSIGGNRFTDISDIKRLATDRKKGPVHNAMAAASKVYSTSRNTEPAPLAPSPASPPPSKPTPQISEAPEISADYEEPETTGTGTGPTWLRYAPVVGSGIGVFNDLIGASNVPNYENANMILESSRNLPDVESRPIGNYLTYRPLDRNYYQNKLDANARATARGIRNTSGGNRATQMAGLLAADYNYGNQMGDLARQAEEYNMAQRERVEGFNRQTDMFNSESDMRAQLANQQGRETKIRGTMAAAQMREEARARADAARAANLTTFFDNLGAIGQEEFSRNMINSNPAFGYNIDRSGRVSYKAKKRKKG